MIAAVRSAVRSKGEEPGATPGRAGDSAGDGGETGISRALPLKPIGCDGDGMALTVIVANEHRAGFEPAPGASLTRMLAPRIGVVLTSGTPVLAARRFCNFLEVARGCGGSSVAAVEVSAVTAACSVVMSPRGHLKSSARPVVAATASPALSPSLAPRLSPGPPSSTCSKPTFAPVRGTTGPATARERPRRLTFARITATSFSGTSADQETLAPHARESGTIPSRSPSLHEWR
jgi:hypothetical protein